MLRYGICGFEVIDPQPSCRLEGKQMANEASRSVSHPVAAGGKDVPDPWGWVDFVVVIVVP